MPSDTTEIYLRPRSCKTEQENEEDSKVVLLSNNSDFLLCTTFFTVQLFVKLGYIQYT